MVSSPEGYQPHDGVRADQEESDTQGVGDEVDSEIRLLKADVLHHGARLDKALAEMVPELSRSYLQQLLAMGLVRCNDAVVSKPAVRLKAGDRLSVEIRPTEQSQAFKPEAMALTVVYEDDHLLVINKPAGLVVHPAPGHWSGTLLNGLLARDPRSCLVPRAGIVHRLDKDTSGLMVVARDRSTMDALVGMIAARDVSRQYVALACGSWKYGSQRRVDAPIGRDPRNRLRMAVVDLGVNAGKPARTDIDLLDKNAEASLVRCTLHTGRTHQIRVHMASLGFPLLADALYGGTAHAGLERQALHAYRLALTHPVTGAALEWKAPLPSDIGAAIDFWGLRYNLA